MKAHWRNYMKLGINHHLLYPASFESSQAHRDSFPGLVRQEAFEVVDLFIMEGGAAEQFIVDELRASGKEAVYNCPLMLGDELNPHSEEEAVRRHTLAELKVHLDRARRLKARKAVVASGIDPGPAHRERQAAYFVEYLAQACRYAGEELELLIEPFDRGIGKNLLIGPSEEARRVVEQVRASGCGNIGILLDMGHVPLMGESFEHAAATLAPYIRHIHLGSCVQSDPDDPLYGDMHPPWGYPGGAHDVREAADFLQALFTIGYLAEGKRETVTLEMRPYPGKSEDESIAIFLAKLDQAWTLL
ncbi:TIM barrel protein [Paenibacillus sp. IB182496]|uniref:TIM barrel protein n=1 Tax=Paenibacillus sabuli TaxID=2772509 RepID=A0A927BXY9_9BACL|nr:TIM barrel protein [Paenibacillus sabuli]MBD2847534.1 TIM barrel protein [Paenibacillus sabuli]